MEKLDHLISDLKTFEESFISMIEEIIKEHSDILIDANAYDQLFEKGITRTGQYIAEYAPYAPITIEIKKQKGQPTARVTLRDEGDFHRSFYVEFQTDGFEMKASDYKTPKLINQYGEEILGLTDDNFKDIIEGVIKPTILKKLKEI